MISKPLLKQIIKSNYKILIIFLLLLGMYVSLIIGMYDPHIQEKMGDLLQSLPPQFLSAFGFNMAETSLTGFVSSYLYGFLLLLIPMVYEIIISQRLIAGQVEKGSMACLLSTPNSRRKIIITGQCYLIGTIAVMVGFVTLLGIFCSEMMFPGKLDILEFLLINLSVFLLHFTISGICCFASCTFNDTKYYLAAGAGIPLLFYLIQMLANMGGKLEKIKYFTVFTLFNPEQIIEGKNNYILFDIVLFISGAFLYFVGRKIFEKRDLPL